MANPLRDKIDAVIASASRLVLATSVGDCSSCSSVFFARDGDDLLFFTFRPTRKARQIRFNPAVQAMIWPGDNDGIRGVRVEGYCVAIERHEEIVAAREKLLAVTDAFRDYMDDEFLRNNGVTGYYRIKPQRITLIDFHAEQPFENLDFPQHRQPLAIEILQALGRRLLLWVTAVRAPFFTASLIPLLLGATIARGDLAATGLLDAWNWGHFWLVLLGAIAAHAGTNMANDYGDHLSGNDELNRAASPFNGGSRVIQAGLMPAWKVALVALVCFLVTIGIGLALNRELAGQPLAPSPLLFFGIAGCLLGVSYTLGPWPLGYRGFGEIAIAIGFGPVIVLGTHFVLSAAVPGPWNWLPVLMASVPISFFVALIIWINQFQDVPADRQVAKRNWVVRCATAGDDAVRYERPFGLYRLLGYLGFAAVALLSLAGGIDIGFGTLYALLAMAPLPLLVYADRLGRDWLEAWNQPQADRDRLPFMLLRVNAITIAIHFSTGILLVLAYGLRSPIWD